MLLFTADLKTSRSRAGRRLAVLGRGRFSGTLNREIGVRRCSRWAAASQVAVDFSSAAVRPSQYASLLAGSGSAAPFEHLGIARRRLLGSSPLRKAWIISGG